jgi:hypothetical protein
MGGRLNQLSTLRNDAVELIVSFFLLPSLEEVLRGFFIFA